MVIIYQSQYSDFGGCIYLHRKMSFLCRKHTKEFGGYGALGWPQTLRWFKKQMFFLLYQQLFCKLVNVSKI